MGTLLPSTEVQARGLRWEVVTSARLGRQALYRLCCLERNLRGEEVNLLKPVEKVKPLIHDLNLERATPSENWSVYQQAFLLEHSLRPDALRQFNQDGRELNLIS